MIGRELLVDLGLALVITAVVVVVSPGWALVGVVVVAVLAVLGVDLLIRSGRARRRRKRAGGGRPPSPIRPFKQ